MFISEPNDIRPSQRPTNFITNQLIYYPVNIKKLPEWVDDAPFCPNNDLYERQQKSNKLIRADQKKQQKVSNSENNLGNLSQTKNGKIFVNLKQKYKDKDQFLLCYDRENPQTFDLKFLKQFVSNDFKELLKYQQATSIQQKQRKYLNLKNKNKKIKFDSKFQSGNLQKVFKAKQLSLIQNIDLEQIVDCSQTLQQYHLIMQNDTNTQGYTQWYCFSINNISNSQTKIMIRIVNFTKSKLLYKFGMRPWVINEENRVWRNHTQNCKYDKTNVYNQFGQIFYQLSFCTLLKPGLTFFSMMPTYSYSKLSNKISQWIKYPGMKRYSKNIYTVINNIVPILEYIPNNKAKNELPKQQKKWLDTIVITARVHPGEVWSSYLLEELVQRILVYHAVNPLKIRYLIIPMLNPDGVIYGNFRCDFTGVDCNRVWQETNKYYQPAIYQLKRIILFQLQKKKAKFHIDIHSHSRKHNIFAFICSQNIFQGRILPDLIRLNKQNQLFDPVKECQITSNFFNQSQCTYLSSRQILRSVKKSTIRAFMSQITEKQNSLTVQISFHGFKYRQNSIKIFQKRDFSIFSRILLEKLVEYILNSQNIDVIRKMIKSIYQIYQKSLIGVAVPKRNSPYLQVKDDDSDSEPEKYYDPSSQVNINKLNSFNKQQKKKKINKKNRLLDQQGSNKNIQLKNQFSQAKKQKSSIRKRSKTQYSKQCNCDANKQSKIHTKKNQYFNNNNQSKAITERKTQSKNLQHQIIENNVQLMFIKNNSNKIIIKQFDNLQNYFQPSSRLKRQQNMTSLLFSQRKQKMYVGKKVSSYKRHYAAPVRQLKPNQLNKNMNSTQVQKQVVIHIDDFCNQDQIQQPPSKKQLQTKQYIYKYNDKLDPQVKQLERNQINKIIRKSNSPDKLKKREYSFARLNSHKRLEKDGQKILQILRRQRNARVSQKNKYQQNQTNIQQIINKRKSRVNTQSNRYSQIYDFSDRNIFKNINNPKAHKLQNGQSYESEREIQESHIFDNQKFKYQRIINSSYIMTPKLHKKL